MQAIPLKCPRCMQVPRLHRCCSSHMHLQFMWDYEVEQTNNITIEETWCGCLAHCLTSLYVWNQGLTKFIPIHVINCKFGYGPCILDWVGCMAKLLHTLYTGTIHKFWSIHYAARSHKHCWRLNVNCAGSYLVTQGINDFNAQLNPNLTIYEGCILKF